MASSALSARATSRKIVNADDLLPDRDDDIQRGDRNDLVYAGSGIEHTGGDTGIHEKSGPVEPATQDNLEGTTTVADETIDAIASASTDPDGPEYNGSADPSATAVATGDQRINGVLSSFKWADGFITYSDPDAAGDYQIGYFSDDDGDGISAQNDGFSALSNTQRNAAHFALDQTTYTQPVGAGGFSVEGFTNLGIDYAGTGTGAGTIRLANSSDPRPASNTAYAYYPSANVTGGDAWFDQAGINPIAGNYHWHNVLHELGHSLGLKHGHETDVFGALPSNVDSMEFSVMTYRSYIGGPLTGYSNETWSYAQTYMMLDIAALQYMYGADYTVNSGNTVYTWSPISGQTLVNGSLAIDAGGNRIFATIWDGGGIDTYNLSSYTTNLRIDLRAGEHSTFSSAQLGNLGSGNIARANVFNALMFGDNTNSLIENAIGGIGNDNITGNGANNTLTGGAGTDTLIGGPGVDTAQFSGAKSLYTVTRSGLTTTVSGSTDGTDTLTGVERLQFADSARSLPTVVDFGGNGRSDILLYNPNGTIGVWDMTGTQITAQSYFGTSAGWRIADARVDHNGDGRSDVLLSNENGMIGFWQMNGTQMVAQSYFATSPGWSISVARADFNGDGKSDVLLQNTNGMIGVWQMNGTQMTAQNYLTTSPGWTVNQAQVDFNADGKNDVLLQNNISGMIGVWQMNGTQIAAQQYYGTSPGWSIRESRVDFNGDGKNDVLLHNSTDNKIGVWLMDGTAITAQKYFDTSPGWSISEARVDFNGDVKNDILLRNSDGTLGLWLMDGMERTAQSYIARPSWDVIDARADFNGDGRNDVLLRSGDTLQLWEVVGTQVTAQNDIAISPGNTFIDAHEDVNFDGKTDILLSNTISRTISVWQMNGTLIGASNAIVTSAGWSIMDV